MFKVLSASLALAAGFANAESPPSTIVSLADPILDEFVPAIHPEHVKELNEMPGMTWKAAETTFSEKEAKAMMGTILLDEDTDPTPLRSFEADPTLLRGASGASDDVPEEFDALKQWPNNIHPIRNQKKCGSCWAFSASEVLSDRFSIASKGADNAVLSPEDLVSCDEKDHGCSGGQLPSAWTYLKEEGIVTDACFPYDAGEGTAGKCVESCEDGSTWTKYKAKNFYKLKTVADIQKEIMTNGPVQVAFRVYKSFMAYKTGVYQRDWWRVWDMIMGGHAVKLVGWGTDPTGGKHGESIDYWKVANSWDTTWGEDGYFRIKRGVNMCGIEGNVYAGEPLL